MKADLRLDHNMRIIGISHSGREVAFDTVPEFGGENTAPPPMQVMLMSLGACTFMDVVSILQKKKNYYPNEYSSRCGTCKEVSQRFHKGSHCLRTDKSRCTNR